MPDSAPHPTETAHLTIRFAQPADVPTLFSLIQALADYEKLSHAVVGSPTALEQHLFGKPTYIEALLAEYDGQPVGFALFFANYSTFLTKPGIYLEDLFVLPDYRGQGIGKALLKQLAKLAIARQCGRLEWSVLDWNEPAIAFYRRMGATILEDHRVCRVTGAALTQLADRPLVLPQMATLRSPIPADLPTLFHLVQEVAALGTLPDVTGTVSALQEHLLGAEPALEAIVAEQNNQVVGLATFCHNYSTFLTKPGIYLEDLFVKASHRQQGLGKALLIHLAKLAVERNCGRLEWQVTTWNEDAIAFYEQMGATVLPDWRICRVMGEALVRLGQ